MPSSYVMRPTRSELEVAKTKLEGAIHRSICNSNSMANWALSGQMQQDIETVSHWRRRVAELTEGVHRCPRCGQLEEHEEC